MNDYRVTMSAPENGTPPQKDTLSALLEKANMTMLDSLGGLNAIAIAVMGRDREMPPPALPEPDEGLLQMARATLELSISAGTRIKEIYDALR